MKSTIGKKLIGATFLDFMVCALPNFSSINKVVLVKTEFI